jgi:methylamine dehydrogenase accessory protein MauD
MDTLSLLSHLALWAVVLLLAFLLVGTLRSLGLVRWRLAQLEAAMPGHVGRRGLRIGSKAPDFVLPSVQGGQVSLQEFVGRTVFLVFTRPGCAPCNRIVPCLNRANRNGSYSVAAIATGDLETVRQWIEQVGAEFPVLVQENLALSRRYEALATPFAFLIDEQGIIISKEIVSDDRDIGIVLSQAASESNAETDHSKVFAPAGKIL